MRVDQITFLRFIAAISIVVFHYGREVFPFNVDRITAVFDQAYFGVSFFFILSGFVMIIAYGRREKKSIAVGEYYKNRVARIYPVYFLALALMVIYYLINHSGFSFIALALNVILLQAWIPPYPLSLNGPGWSLSVEFFFYAVFPFLFNYIYSRKGLKKIAVPIFLIWAATQIVFNYLLKSRFFEGFPSPSHDLLFYSPLIHLNEFLIGNLAGLFFLGLDKGAYKNYDWAIVALTASLFILLSLELDINYHDGLLAVVFIPMILLFSINTGRLTGLFNRKAFIFLGEISYGIYILQKPVYEFTIMIVNSMGFRTFPGLFYFYLIILTVISGLSYTYFEAPLRRWIKNTGIPGSMMIRVKVK